MNSSQGRLTRTIPPISRPDAGQDVVLCLAGVLDFPGWQGLAGLRKVPAFTAAEVAEQLGTTVAAVYSALQRARPALAVVGDAGEVTEPDDPEAQAVVQRYMQAFEAADVPALVRLLADDAVLERATGSPRSPRTRRSPAAGTGS